LLYIAIESKRAKIEHQRNVQRIGIYGAMILRIVLLFVLIKAIGTFEGSVFKADNGLFEGDFNLHSLIVLFGGVFIIYKATSEIIHMLHLDTREDGDRKPKSTNSIILSIILMNLIFSFDSILVAMALTDEFVIMATAIITGALIMIFWSIRWLLS
jgi:predicted tellurium resistance membrane protein TerC